MIIQLKGYSLYLGVVALKEVVVDDVKAFLCSISETTSGVEFQVLNLRYVAGLRHVLTSVLVSLEAFKHGLNIANSLPMELLVRASGQRQISKALKLLGVKKGRQNLVLALIDENRNQVEEAIARLKKTYGDHLDEEILEADRSRQLMEIYGISEEEVRAEEAYARGLWDSVKNLIAERVVLTLIS